MKLRELISIILVIILIVLGICSKALSVDGFSGQVSDASDKKGISNLVVKLTPPRDSQEAQKITTTDHDGDFVFTGLKQMRYLFEVYQGPTLLYRDVVDTKQETNRTLMLKSK
jgi:hypothetical protein